MSTYNGWVNWETWKTNLELVDGISGEDLGLTPGMDPYDAGLVIQEHAMEAAGDWESNSFTSTIVWEFFNQVNWTDIAEHLLEQMEPEQEREE